MSTKAQMKTRKKTLVFSATDTLFFRESRPMESMGELQSVFPPPVRTLAGAVRTFIGEQQGINWKIFHAEKGNEQIGYGDDLGKLSFQGAWLTHDGQRLYPAPLLLMQKDDDVQRLTLAKQGIWCDLGKKVRLPELPTGAEGSKALENTWLTQADFERVLQGEMPDSERIKKADDLFERESRVGIARNNATRTVEPGLLYQTNHIRPGRDVSIELDAAGFPDDLPDYKQGCKQDHHVLRLGGEGRTARLVIQEEAGTFPQAPAIANDQGVMLYLLTPLKMRAAITAAMALGFDKKEPDASNTSTIWTGTLNGIELELHGAVTGKVQREGGWDMAKHQPRAVTSLIPAGSCFFCKVKNGDTRAAIKALHNQQIGELTAYGYGHLAVGIWKE